MSGIEHQAPQGLFDPRLEHDGCGFGLIAHLDDAPSREIVDLGLSALSRMTHRGAVAADGESGDGCGLLIRRPEAFIRALAEDHGFSLAPLATAGLVFLPIDESLAARCRSELQAQLEKVGSRIAGWRQVPINPQAAGPLARERLPRIEQVFVNADRGEDAAGFQRGLYTARRRAEMALVEVSDFHVVTLAEHSLGYKGMVMPERLREFYPDLSHPRLASSAVVFHQRFSTNTMPRWALAQPFRFLAHNGEINTIRGNRFWARARGARMRSPFVDFREFKPLVSQDSSDSASLDNMLEVLLTGGMDLLQAMRILIPPAWQNVDGMDPDLRAFYEYFALHMEPWDGPAGIVVADSRYAACALDRNGLRPARWALSKDRMLVVASEAGVVDWPARDIVAKGRLGPGEMLAVDLHRGEFLDTARIDQINRERAPFKRWLKQGVRYLETDLIDPSLAAEPMPREELLRHQKMFNLSAEERDTVLKVLAETEGEAIGSMGDDTPLPLLSTRVRSLYDAFRQAFAQVTNPPIDSYREKLVMSLHTQIARESNLFELNPAYARQVMINSPVLSQRKFLQILALREEGVGSVVIDLNYAQAEGLDAALARCCRLAEDAVREGKLLVVLSDRAIREGHLPIHALLAVGAVHQHLVACGLRSDCNLLVETATARDPHHFACLIGYGATAVYPYLAFQTIFDLARSGDSDSRLAQHRELGRSYRRGIRNGLLKILSKMGISTVASYRGAALFEIVGLSNDVVARCFAGTPSRVGGPGFADIEADQQQLAERAWNTGFGLEAGGLFKYMHGGEYHAFNPDVVGALQVATLTGEHEDWLKYAKLVNEREPSMLRDLLEPDFEGATPIALDEVEPASAMFKAFDSAGMSLGALSPEAHEALAIAMNRLGGRSNSGEGGEDPARYGTEKTSRIKQVASGRFGVTPEYLVNADVLQIKVAQGAKPGEGGQLPGHKVNELIARLRYAKPGIGLISPPPHHDIYSIEDLAQLIYDLKQINPTALVSVKLVSHAGVGTIAAGVAKAGADLITVSGYDGGTGASPLTSIKYAGGPWELGLTEAHHALRANGLRDRIILQTDGGLKTGLDVLKAALLGADSFGFGTAPMIALGCKYLRICHLNNCATGVATQHHVLRAKHFKGMPEQVMAYFIGVVEELRGYMARLGIRTLAELTGRSDLLRPRPNTDARRQRIDLRPILAPPPNPPAAACAPGRPTKDPDDFHQRLLAEVGPAIEAGTGGRFSYPVRNVHRSVGTALSGLIARRHGNTAMAANPVRLDLSGSVGQSFGAFNAGGLELHLTGEANDYVGKGMAGGLITVRPPDDARYLARKSAILGNTCLYGATGGDLFAAGTAGQRFAVRNSGATAVVEGAGDHCCEYMTGGVVAVLGSTGLNFGAGMTGGFAYVLDLDRSFVDRYNHELIDLNRITLEGLEAHLQHLRGLIERHRVLTGSTLAAEVLDDFRGFLPRFWLVKPKAAGLDSLINALRRAA